MACLLRGGVMWKWLKIKKTSILYAAILPLILAVSIIYTTQGTYAPQYNPPAPTSSRPFAQPTEIVGEPMASDEPYVGAVPGAEQSLGEGAKSSSDLPPGLSWDKYDLLVQRGLQQLKRFDIYHNNPETLPLDKATKIVLSVASKDKTAAKAAADAAYGPTIAAQADLGMSVRAELVGADSDVGIQAVGQPIRSISAGSNTTWEWFVLPKTTDDFEMTLRLYNQHQLSDRVVETEGPAYTNVFHVHATLGQKLKLWLSLVDGWLALLGGSIVALAGWLLTKLKGRFWPGKPAPKGGPKKAKKP